MLSRQLLKKEMKIERDILMQCITHFVEQHFFDGVEGEAEETDSEEASSSSSLEDEEETEDGGSASQGIQGK